MMKSLRQSHQLRRASSMACDYQLPSMAQWRRDERVKSSGIRRRSDRLYKQLAAAGQASRLKFRLTEQLFAIYDHS